MKINDNYELKKILDTYVLVDNSKNSNQIIKLNELSKTIFEYIIVGKNKEEIIELLQSEYDVSKDQLINDMNEFINVLRSKGIING